jgi:hypothetical protein
MYNLELHSTALTAVQGPMSSYIRQRLPLYKVVSSYIRHRLPLYKVQCRVIFDSAYRCKRYNVELHSTAPTFCTVSSYIRQRNLLYKVQSRVTFDSAYRCTKYSVELHSSALTFCIRYGVELHSTALTAVQGKMSSCIRQRLPLYKVQCRIKFDSTYL